MALDLTARVTAQQDREQRDADLDKRDREHGGMESLLDAIDREHRAESTRDWRAYRPSVTRSEVATLRSGATIVDPRRVTIQRLYVDCGAAVRRWAKKYKRDAADTLRHDALLLLLDWPAMGDADSKTGAIDLGGEGGTPLRRDWLEPVDPDARGPRDVLTDLAWKALHAAVKQAARHPSFLRLTASKDEPNDPADLAATLDDPRNIAARVEQQRRDTLAATRLPDNAAPETIARTMDVPLDAARALTQRAHPFATPRDLAEAWGISEQAVANALSRGKRKLRELYPEPGELLDALDAAASAYRATVATDAVLALLDYRHGAASEADALTAARDWRSTVGEMAPERRALLLAALAADRRHARRAGKAPDATRAEKTAEYVALILRAERKRAARLATLASRGSQLSGQRASASTAPARSVAAIGVGAKLAELRAATVALADVLAGAV